MIERCIVGDWQTFAGRHDVERRESSVEGRVVGGADEELVGHAERFGDLGAHELTDVTTRCARDDATGDPSVGDGVVAGAGAGLPCGNTIFHAGDGGIPVRDVLGSEGFRHGVQTGLVTHRLRDGDRVLAVLTEGRPVLGHWCFVVEDVAIGQLVDGQGGRSLGARKAEEQRVGSDRPRVAGSHRSGGDVEHCFAV